MLKQLTVGLNRLSFCYLFCLLVWFGLRWVWFDQIVGLALLNTGAFFLLLPLAIALPWCAWQRRWGVLAGFGIPLALALHWYLPLFLPAVQMALPAIAQDGLSLKVMSFNVLWSNQDYDAIARSIRAENPDIIGFQELRPEHLPEIQARLGNTYPYSAIHPQPDYHTVGSLSRFPIESLETFSNPPIERGLKLGLRLNNAPAVSSSLTAPVEASLNLWVMHLAPNNLSDFGARGWMKRVGDRFTQRLAQVAQIETAIASSPSPNLAPTVMLCDCNMTSTSQTYAQLSRIFQDSFWETGWGLGHTYVGSGTLPLQRIDYVWHSEGIQTIEAHVASGGASDHLPVVATLRIRT